jgi:hypothetical protein
MKKVKRLRIKEEYEKFYRDYLKGKISFQRWVDLCIENEIRRQQKKRLRMPF